jgi:hypothetical protein
MNVQVAKDLPRIDAPRAAVLCVGAPHGFGGNLEVRNLSAIDIDSSNIDLLRARVGELAAGSKAILVFSGPLAANLLEQQKLKKILNAVTPQAFANALRIAVFVDGDFNDVAKASEILGMPNCGSSAYSMEEKQIRLALRGLLEYRPGPAWRDLFIENHVEDDDKILIQRAFSDCDSISLRKIAVNKSVYRVDARRSPEPHPIPFLVKVDTTVRINKECGNIVELCADTIPFPFVPPMIPQRSAVCGRRSAMVLHFVDRAILLAEYASSHNINRAILSIFDDALRVWRSQPVSKQYELGAYVLDSGIASGRVDDYRSAQEATAKWGSKTPPEELLSRLRALPSIGVYEVHSHGDLHMKNVFVRQSGEVVLIDFLRSGPAPSSRDPAELECSIAFDRDAGPKLSTALLRAVYTAPLLPARSPSYPADHRLDAICQVRRQMGSIVGETEYRIMVAAHLLWWASARNHPLAYYLAERLILDSEAPACTT